MTKMGMSVLQMAKTAFKLKHIYMLHVAKKHYCESCITRYAFNRHYKALVITGFTHINMFDSTKLSNQCQIYVIYLCYIH